MEQVHSHMQLPVTHAIESQERQGPGASSLQHPLNAKFNWFLKPYTHAGQLLVQLGLTWGVLLDVTLVHSVRGLVTFAYSPSLTPYNSGSCHGSSTEAIFSRETQKKKSVAAG